MLQKSLPPRLRQRQSVPPHITAGSKSTSPTEQHRRQAATPSSLLPQFPGHCTASSSMPVSNPGNGANVDQVLFENLVEVVPLIETLMGQRANSSFSRRASVIYTPAPSRPNKLQNAEPKGFENSIKKKKDRRLSVIKDTSTDCKDRNTNDPLFPSKPMLVECSRKNDEINILKEELDELQKRLLEKDESLKTAENTVNDLKHHVQQKETLIRSTQSQLNNAKINLADKQATLEKLQWVAKEADSHAMKLQEKLDFVEFEVSSFMRLYREMSKTASVSSFDENTSHLHEFEQLPVIDFDETAIEGAQRAYVEALAALKMDPSEESVSNAAAARMKLHALVL